MRSLLVAAVLLASSVAVAKGKGAAVDLDFTQVPVGNVVRLLADVGKFNVVFLDGADTGIDIRAKLVPWDDVLVDVVAKANLAFTREGSLYIVGPQAAIDARKAQKKAKYTGAVLDIDVVGVEPADVGALLSVATGKPVVLEGGKTTTLRLRKVPADLARDMIALQSGATIGSPPPKPDPKAKPAETKPPEAKPTEAKKKKDPNAKPCVAATLPLTDLEIIGIVRVGTKSWAMFGTRSSAETYIADKTSCLGIEGAKVRAIGSSDLMTVDHHLFPLHPEPMKMGETVHK